MSRIGGVISAQAKELLPGVLARLGRGTQIALHAHDLHSSSASFGWTGWQAPNLAQRGGTILTLDGHIYNRDELGATQQSDAELFLDLFEKHGFDVALSRINGDFAVALYDGSSKILWLGRDRIGIKPLYYTHKTGLCAFASRPAALLGLPGVSNEINQRFTAVFAASHYRYFDNKSHESPFRDVNQLPAGHLLKCAGGTLSLKSYWGLGEQEESKESEEVLAERYRDLLLGAVRDRVKVARKPAFTLSGGMDSSSVLACAVKSTTQKQHAFSTVYEDKTYDESSEIRSMLKTTVSQWHTVSIGTPDTFDLVRKMVVLHDEPVATATWLSHYLLCEQAAREGFGSLFGGLGGDELNAGEYEYFFFFFADLKRAKKDDLLKSETEKWIEYHDHPIFKKTFSVMEDGLRRLVDIDIAGRCLVDQKRYGRYLSVLNPDFYDINRFQPEMDHPFSSYLKNRTYQDIFRETAPCCLRAEDRQTAAYGLDNFLPFFDYRVVEFMFRVNGSLKIRQGVTKHLLRQAMRGILPEETRTRIKKTGWNAPAHIWFSGKGGKDLLDLVHSKKFTERGIYLPKEVTRIVNEHEEIVRTGKMVDNHMMFLWQLVNLELWLESL